MRVLLSLAFVALAGAAQATPSAVVLDCARESGVRGVISVHTGFADGRSFARLNSGRNVSPQTAQVVNACAARHGVNTDPGSTEVVRARGRLFCGYPHRPSDSAFHGGSGYLIKDDVRRANGC